MLKFICVRQKGFIFRLQLSSVWGTEKRARVRVRASELELEFSIFFPRSRTHTHSFCLAVCGLKVS
jgi:hypothetical protein